jgi:hypothetical protein
MRDWQAYVAEHLRLPPGGCEANQETVIELGAHLDECSAELCAGGATEEEAYQRTIAVVGSWEELQRGIIAAKQEGDMRDRVMRIWIPGLVTLVFSSAVLAVMQWAGVKPVISHAGEPRQFFLYIPWLILLPPIGALAGYLSRRANGEGWRVYFAASLPAIGVGTFFVLLFPLTFVIDPQVPMSIKGPAIVAGMLNWVVLPGAALSLGVALQGLRKVRHA